MSKYVGKKQIFSIVLLGVLMTILTARGSKATVEEAKDSQIVIAEEAVVEEEAGGEVSEPEPVEEAVPEVTVEETTHEPTEEPMPEPIVYEGIDMESTLPAGEWVNTFFGIINEPKFVVTNSETKKKVIVEEGQKVTLEQGDVLGVYLNDGIMVGFKGIHVIATENVTNFYDEFELDTFTEETVFEAKISTTEGKKFISCILVPN